MKKRPGCSLPAGSFLFGTGVTPKLVLLIVLHEVLIISAVFWRGRRRLDEVARNAYAEGYRRGCYDRCCCCA